VKTYPCDTNWRSRVGAALTSTRCQTTGFRPHPSRSPPAAALVTALQYQKSSWYNPSDFILETGSGSTGTTYNHMADVSGGLERLPNRLKKVNA
jgi:fibrillarin-like rRNA methylase